MLYLQPIYSETIQLELSELNHKINRGKNRYNFFMILKEEVDIKIGLEAYHYNEYDLFFLLSSDQFEYIGNQNALILSLSIDADYLINAVPAIDAIIQQLRIQDTSALEPLRPVFASLAKNYFNQNSNDQYEFASTFYRFLHMLSNPTPSSKLLYKNANSTLELKVERIQKIKSYIEMNFNKQLTMNELAESLFLTPQYLSKFIKEQLGVTFIHYLNTVRLKHAVEELLNTKHGITQISFNNGFPNLTAFNKAFRDTYFDTPMKYRQLTQKNNSVQIEKVKPGDNNMSADSQYIAKIQLERIIKKYDNLPATPTSEKTIIQANVKKSISFYHSGFKMINLGFAINILSHSFQQQLTNMQKELDFKYARFQGIIEPEIIDKIPNTEDYNYSNANRIIDFLYSVQLLPFIEIGRKPRKFNPNPNNYVYLSNYTAVFKTVKEQAHFISHFIQHCINRYGLVVSSNV